MPITAEEARRRDLELRAYIEDRLHYLIETYGYEAPDVDMSNWGMSLRYRNRHAGMAVRLAYEKRDQYCSTSFATLNEGEFRTGTDQRGHTFTVNTLVALRHAIAPEQRAFLLARQQFHAVFARTSGASADERMRAWVAYDAEALRAFGDDVLRGSTASFPALQAKQEETRSIGQQAEQEEVERTRALQLAAAGAKRFTDEELAELAARTAELFPTDPYWAKKMMMWTQQIRDAELGFDTYPSLFCSIYVWRDKLELLRLHLEEPLRTKFGALLAPWDERYERATFPAKPLDKTLHKPKHDPPGPWWHRIPRKAQAQWAPHFQQLGLPVEEVPDRTDVLLRLFCYRAIIDVDQTILGYVLNAGHPLGQHKARTFQNLLGYNATNYQDFVDQLRVGIVSNDSTSETDDRLGSRCVVPIPMVGPAGAATVHTVWIFDPPSYVPRLLTAGIIATSPQGSAR